MAPWFVRTMDSMSWQAWFHGALVVGELMSRVSMSKYHLLSDGSIRL